MKNKHLFLPKLWAFIGLPVTIVNAQDSGIFQLPAGEEANRFSLNSRFAFNISAEFSPNSSSASGPGSATGGGVDREYDNGFVRVDSSGNANGQTWNWGYSGERTGGQSGPQVDLNNNSIAFDAADYSGLSSGEIDNDPQAGFEFGYMRYVGQMSNVTWGIESGFSYLNLSISDKNTGSTITDFYSLGGIIPPQAPYEGSFAGPGPVISDEPFTREVTEGRLERKLHGHLYGVRIGPFFEFPLYENAAVQLAGGFAAVYADTSFKFGGSSGSDNEWLLGGYIEGNIILPLTETVGFFGGIQYQALENMTQQSDNIAVKLNTDSSVFLSLGLTTTF